MKTPSFLGIFFVLLHVPKLNGQIGGLSSKLDFGQTVEQKPSSKRIIETIISVRQVSPEKEKTPDFSSNPFNMKGLSVAAEQAAARASDGLQRLGVLCTGGRCNATNAAAPEHGSKADVLVQVLTNVQENTTGTKAPEIKGNGENADVPVIIGTGNRDSNSYQQASTRRVPHSHFNPHLNNHYFGESSPPLNALRPMKNNAYNPNAFVSRQNSNNWRRSSSSAQQMAAPPICTCVRPSPHW